MTRVRLSLCLPAPDSSWSSLATQSPGALKTPRTKMIESLSHGLVQEREVRSKPGCGFPCHSATQVSALAGTWAHPGSRMFSDTHIPRSLQASPHPLLLICCSPLPFPPSTVFVCTSVHLPDFIQPTSQTFTCRQGCPKCIRPGDLLCELCS